LGLGAGGVRAVMGVTLSSKNVTGSSREPGGAGEGQGRYFSASPKKKSREKGAARGEGTKFPPKKNEKVDKLWDFFWEG